MAQNFDVVAPSVVPVIALGTNPSDQPLISGKPPSSQDPSQTHQKLYKEPNMRISRWESAQDRSKRVSGWHSPSEKTFTPQCFSYFPREMTLLDIEIWTRRHRIDDLQRRIAEQDYEANDGDIRSPSPEPIYDAKTGQRSNTRD
jgi:hypothetical protein